MQYTHPTSVRSKLNNSQLFTLHHLPSFPCYILHGPCVRASPMWAHGPCVCVCDTWCDSAGAPNPLPEIGSAYPTQHNTTYARYTNTHVYTHTHTYIHIKHTHLHVEVSHSCKHVCDSVHVPAQAMNSINPGVKRWKEPSLIDFISQLPVVVLCNLCGIPQHIRRRLRALCQLSRWRAWCVRNIGIQMSK